MKKITGIVFAMLMVGVVLTGCYNQACEQPTKAPVSYKGEDK